MSNDVGGGKDLFLCRVVVMDVVSDDDSCLRSHCVSIKKRRKVSRGGLRVEFPCRPYASYRAKVMVKAVFALVKRTTEIR